MTLGVLSAFARDIQCHVRGRIIRTARRQEMCAATRIQAWYQGWLVRSRDGYGAVIKRMRNHRLERAKRIKVCVAVNTPVNTPAIERVSSLLCGAPLPVPVAQHGCVIDTLPLCCSRLCAVLTSLLCPSLPQNMVFHISTLKPAARRLVAKMRERKQALHSELRRYVSLRKFRRYAARALIQSREDAKEAKRAAKQQEWDALDDHDQINQLLRDDTNGKISLHERPNDEGWTLKWWPHYSQPPASYH